MAGNVATADAAAGGAAGSASTAGSANTAGNASTAGSANTAATGRPRLWAELILLSIGYGLYTLTRDLAPARRLLAFADADDIRTMEGWLHITVERQANLWLTVHPVLAMLADYYYATIHFVAVISVLVWLYWRRPALYRQARAVLVATTLAALTVFWLFPVAPPRLLPGYVDTLVVQHTWGSWGTSGVTTLANQYAAMPSLHTAWAAWTAGVLVIAARRTAVRIVAVGYPLLTIAVIVATANHYLLDAVGGLVVLALSAVAVRVIGTDRAGGTAAAADDAAAAGAARRVGPVPAVSSTRLADAAQAASTTRFVSNGAPAASTARRASAVLLAGLLRASGRVSAVRACCWAALIRPAPAGHCRGRARRRASAPRQAHAHCCGRGQ